MYTNKINAYVKPLDVNIRSSSIAIEWSEFSSQTPIEILLNGFFWFISTRSARGKHCTKFSWKDIQNEAISIVTNAYIRCIRRKRAKFQAIVSTTKYQDRTCLPIFSRSNIFQASQQFVKLFKACGSICDNIKQWKLDYKQVRMLHFFFLKAVRFLSVTKRKYSDAAINWW